MFAKFHLLDHNPWFFRRYVSACMRSLIFVKSPNNIIKEKIIVLKLVDTMLEPDCNIKVERLRTPIFTSKTEICSPCHNLGARLWYHIWMPAFRTITGAFYFQKKMILKNRKHIWWTLAWVNIQVKNVNYRAIQGHWRSKIPKKRPFWTLAFMKTFHCERKRVLKKSPVFSIFVMFLILVSSASQWP